MIKFGTDGWRAVIAQDFTFENVQILSQAVADYLKNNNRGTTKRIVMGYDRRFMSDKFADTAALVFAANDIKVTLSHDFVPTPTISWHCKYKKYDLGVMITASHNPYYFNGYKLKTPEGGSADKAVTDAVERLLGKSKVKTMEQKDAEKKGLLKIVDLTCEQVKFLQSFVDLKRIRRMKLRVLVDLMHGSGQGFIEKILGSKIDLKIDYIHADNNPSFSGVNPEPITPNLQVLMQQVKTGKYDMGVALDGDADRIAMVDSKGNYINAQVLVPLLAVHMIKNRKSLGGIGKTVVGSNVIDAVALDLGAACYETPVGFKYISNLFQKNLICIGGEEAGGIGYTGYIPERDGSISFLLILEMLACEHKNFSQALNDFYEKYGRWYYSRSAILVKNLKKGIESLKLPETIFNQKINRINRADGIKLICDDYWLMFRASGTEPIVRIYAESKSQALSEKLVLFGQKMIYDL